MTSALAPYVSGLRILTDSMHARVRMEVAHDHFCDVHDVAL